MIGARRAASTSIQATNEYDRAQPLTDQVMPLLPERLQGDRLRIIGHRLETSGYLRKWREANPELARRRNREALAAHRARKTAMKRLREFSHATAFLKTDEYKAARAALADEIDRRVSERYPHLSGTCRRRPPHRLRGI
jgi:hypothetical protein